MGKNIFITGASSGIGKAIGDHLINEGHHVIGTSRRPHAGAGNFPLLQMDVTDEESVQRACMQAVEMAGQIDVLVNNAGFGISGPVEHTPIKDAIAQLNTNYFGTVRTTTALLPHFRSRQDGLIINISSLGGLLGLPFQAHYSASKFALEGFTEALRLEVAPFGIRVCNINPGDFKTGFTANRQIAAEKDTAYQGQFTRFLTMYEKDENAGSDPQMVARLVASLLHKKHVQIRYTVGKPEQTMAIGLKRLLGNRLFEKMVRTIWGV